MRHNRKRNITALAGATLAIAINPLSASALTAGEVFGAVIGGALGAIGAAAAGNSAPSNSTTGYQDLVGTNAASGDTALRQRGYQDRGGYKTSDTSYVYWTQVSTSQCILVGTYDGRFASIVPASAYDCNNAGGTVAQQPSSPAVRPAPATYTTVRPDNGIDIQITDGNYRVYTTLRPGENGYNGQDGVSRIYFNPLDGHVVVSSSETGEQFYNYYAQPVNVASTRPGQSGAAQRSLTCRFNNNTTSQCPVQVFGVPDGINLQITFPDGYVRKLTFRQGDFFDGSSLIANTRADSQFFYVTYSNEYFEIPRSLL